MSDDRVPVEPTPPPAPQPAVTPPSAPPASAPSGTGQAAGRRRLGAVWWGIALIAIGAVLLVNQFVPGVQLWRYWPLIIVAVGIRGMFGSSTGHWSMKAAAEGLTVVAVGLVFLGQMLGYLAWDVWFNIFRLWPVLLVSLGLEIIGKASRAEWLRVFASLVVVAALAYGALVMSPASGWPGVFVIGTAESTPFSESSSHEADVTEGQATVEAGVGEFTLEAGRDLASAEGRSPFDLRFETSTSDEQADVTIALEGSVVAPAANDARLDATLDESVAWDLDIDAGVSSFDVDLSDLPVRSLDFDAGVSSGIITLGAADAAERSEMVSASIKGGISALTIRVPKGEAARVSVQGGLAAVDFSGEWDRADDDGDRRVYTSPRFRDTDAYWDIEIDAGIGSIDIEYY